MDVELLVEDVVLERAEDYLKAYFDLDVLDKKEIVRFMRFRYSECQDQPGPLPAYLQQANVWVVEHRKKLFNKALKAIKFLFPMHFPWFLKEIGLNEESDV